MTQKSFQEIFPEINSAFSESAEVPVQAESTQPNVDGNKNNSGKNIRRIIIFLNYVVMFLYIASFATFLMYILTKEMYYTTILLFVIVHVIQTSQKLDVFLQTLFFIDHT